LMTTMRVVGECFFWYRLTRVFPDKFHRAVKRLCVMAAYLKSSQQVAHGYVYHLQHISKHHNIYLSTPETHKTSIFCICSIVVVSTYDQLALKIYFQHPVQYKIQC